MSRRLEVPSRIVIVGGGIAGTALSLQLSRLGYRCTVLERSHAIAPGPAEVLFPAAVERLRSVGIEIDELEPEARLGAFVIRALSPGAHGLPLLDRGGSPHGAYVIRRHQLVPRLWQRARAAGVELRTSVVASALASDGGRARGVIVGIAGGGTTTVEADLVVVATGSLGMEFGAPRLATQLLGYAAIQEFVGGSAPSAFRLDFPARLPELQFGAATWSYPAGEGRIIVGAAAAALFGDAHSTIEAAVHSAFADRVANDPAMRGEPVGPLFGGAVPTLFDANDAARPGVLYVGDAVGNVASLTGNGIGVALETARLASAAIVAGGDVEADYVAAVRKRFGRTLTATPEYLHSKTMFWRVLDGCLGTSGVFGRAIARHFLDERDTDDDRDRQTTAKLAASHVGVETNLLGEIHEQVLDTIHARFPLLGKLCETLWPDPAEPVRAACVLGAQLGAPASARRLDAAVGLELMNLGIHFHDDVAQRADDEHPDRLAARNSFAIAAGDHLAAEAYRIFSRLGCDVVRLAGRTTEASIRGRVRAMRGSNATMDEYLAACRDSTGEIYGFAVALGCLVSGASAPRVDAYNEIGVELGILVALVEEFEDLRRYVSRRPIARWVTGRELPHLALILTPSGDRVTGETARLLALARNGDFAAGAALATRLVNGGQATGVRRIIRERLAGIERRVAELGPPALPLLHLGRNVADRVLA